MSSANFFSFTHNPCKVAGSEIREAQNAVSIHFELGKSCISHGRNNIPIENDIGGIFIKCGRVGEAQG